MLLILGFGERNPGLTRILTGHALMFEQDRLQGRINQLFERIEAQLRQVLREKKMREGEGYNTDETLLASQIPHFAKGCSPGLCAASLNIDQRTILTPAGR